MAAGCGTTPENPNAGKTLKVGTSANFPPYEYHQKSSKSFTGFDIELANALARDMGYDKVEFVDMKFNDLPKALTDKKVDVLISAISVTEKRKGYLDFTNPYVKDSIKIVVPTNTKLDAKNLKSVEGLRVAVEEGTTAWHEANRQKAKEVITCNSTEEALDMIIAGKADVALADRLTVYFFAHHNLQGKIDFANDSEFSPSSYAMCVRKGDKEMLDKLNAALGKFRQSAEFTRLCRTYFGDADVMNRKK